MRQARGCGAHLLAQDLPGLGALGGRQLVLDILRLRGAEDGAVRVLQGQHIANWRLAVGKCNTPLTRPACRRLAHSHRDCHQAGRDPAPCMCMHMACMDTMQVV
jgi:hypothetical protein